MPDNTAPQDATPEGSQPRARHTVPWVWIGLFGVVFVAMLASIFWHLTADFLPPTAIDIKASSYVQTGERTAALTLFVQNVPQFGEVHHRVVPKMGDDNALTVIVEPSSAQENAAQETIESEPSRTSESSNTGTITLKLALPVRPFVRVLDRRWHRGSENPEGCEFRIQPLSPPAK